jgi:hypothetical protein
MDQCVEQLNALKGKCQNERSFFKGSSLHFKGLTDNGGVVQFEIEARGSKQAIDVRLVGQLIYKDSNRTLVRLWIGVTRQSIILDLIITIGLCLVFILLYQDAGAIFAVICMGLIIPLTTLYSFGYLQNELYAPVYDALFITQVPRPDTLPR